MKTASACVVHVALGGALLLTASFAHADPAPPPGFLEPIVHWGVQKGETCEDIAKVMYGSTTHVPLINRYNRVVCAAGKPLPEGTTLILPKTVTSVPDARIKSSHPDVRGRPSGGSWAIVATGSPLYRNHNLQTMEDGRAHVEFLDHTHVFIAQNTLIVVYGTAAKTQVSKVAPTVELQTGEVQAGLSALRGEPAVVAVPDGGSVSATSKDTVVERKSTRTTVAVFEGKARVSSGGKNVDVPTNYGTRFVGPAAPAPPRPLPPAPLWEEGGSSRVVLAPEGSAVLAVSWKPVEKAKAYRVELARENEFHDLVVREEVGADVHAFRAENMPIGAYFMRVRAIDTEEYLGIASAVRMFEVVAANIRGEGSRLETGKIVANPYGTLALATDKGIDVALDEGPFGTAPSEIDLLRQAPKELKFRTQNGNIEPIVVEYTPVVAEVQTTLDRARWELNVDVEIKGTSGINVAERIGPDLRIRWAKSIQTAGLGATDKTGAKLICRGVPIQDTVGPVRLEVIDSRGRVLGTTTTTIPERPSPPPPPRPLPKQIGLQMPAFRPTGVTGMPWSSPTAPNAAGIGVSGGQSSSGAMLAGNVRASGSVGPLGVDALIETTPFEPAYPADADYPPNENMGWIGMRYRALRNEGSTLEAAPVLRLGFPLLWKQQSMRLDVGAAVGGAREKMTWLFNAGGQILLRGNDAQYPGFQPYLIAGGTYDPLGWMRLYAALDVHVLATLGDGQTVVPYGLSAGLETNGPFFVALSGWVGRAETIETKFAGLGTLSLGFRLKGDPH